MSHAAFVAVSAADIAALYIAAGAMAVVLWACRAPQPAPLPPPVARRIAWITGVCTAVLAADTLLILLQRGHVMSGLPYGRLWPLLPQVLRDTHFGHVWMLRGAAVAVLAGTLWARRRTAVVPAAPVTLLLLAVIVFTRSATGHSADQGDWTVAELVDLLHIVTGIAWAGAVVAAAALWVGSPWVGDGGFARFARRLSQLATVGFVGVVLSGTYNTWLRLDNLQALWNTPYGRHLGWKLILVGIMAVLGAVNRFVHLARLEAGDAAAGRFRRNVYIEAWVAAAVFAAAAILVNTQPPHAAMSAMPGMAM